MPIIYEDTEQSIVPVTIQIPFSLWSAANTSIAIAGSGVGPGIIPSHARLCGVLIQKEVPFDTNTVEIGHAVTAGTRDTIATAAEVDAITAGVASPASWRSPTGFAHQLLSANRGIYARLGAGALPTVGMLRLTLLLHYDSPRAIF